MAQMRARLDRANQSALQKQATVNKRSATAELNVILAEYFKARDVAPKPA